MSWNKLSMRDRAAYIKLGINNGITDLNTIREIYNKFEEGGTIDKGDSKDTIKYEPDIIVSDADSYIGTRLIERSPGVYYDTISGKILHDYDKMPHATVTSYRNSSTGNTLSDITNNLQRAYARGIPSGTMKADMEVANAISGGVINALLPSQMYGAISRGIGLYNDTQDRGFFNNLLFGNNGVVTDSFAKNHPYLSAGINLGADLIAPIKLKIKNAKIRDFSKLTNLKFKTAKSQQLDWTPEHLFEAGNNFSYTPEDLRILKSHIPEYKNIERLSKQNGTYLKMPDGTTYKGDPREWVIAQSKNVKDNFNIDELYHHGNDISYITKEGRDVSGDILGERTLWTSTNPILPMTYGNKHYTFVIPKNTKFNKIVDAEGRNWRNVLRDANTNDIANTYLTDDSAIRINNVVDPGPNHFDKNLPKPLSGESVMDYSSRVFTGDDIVLGKNVIRKSLLGNNGTFDPLVKSTFKVSLPTFFYLKNNNE